MMNNEQAIAALSPHASEKHQHFNARLLPTVDPAQVLGVKMGDIRGLAKTVSGEDARAFLQCTPHPYVELNILHMLLINAMNDAASWREHMEAFLPHLDNWMVTDAISPVLLTRKSLATSGRDHVIEAASQWCVDGRPYVARVGIVIALLAVQRDYLIGEIEAAVSQGSVAHNDYYVHMAAAWFFATYFEHAPDHVEGLLRSTTLTAPVRLKAIQKIIESRKTSEEVRERMRALRSDIRILV